MDYSIENTLLVNGLKRINEMIERYDSNDEGAFDRQRDLLDNTDIKWPQVLLPVVTTIVALFHENRVLRAHLTKSSTTRKKLYTWGGLSTDKDDKETAQSIAQVVASISSQTNNQFNDVKSNASLYKKLNSVVSYSDLIQLLPEHAREVCTVYNQSVRHKVPVVRVNLWNNEIAEKFKTMFAFKTFKQVNAYLSAVLVRVMIKSVATQTLRDNTDLTYGGLVEFLNSSGPSYSDIKKIPHPLGRALARIIAIVDNIVEAILNLETSGEWFKFYITNTSQHNLRLYLSILISHANTVFTSFNTGQRHDIPKLVQTIAILASNANVALPEIKDYTADDIAQMRSLISKRKLPSVLDCEAIRNELHLLYTYILTTV